MNFKKLLERHTIFKGLLLILGLLSSIAYVHSLISPYLKFVLVLGLLIILVDLVRGRLNLKDPCFWLLIAFAAAYCVTAIKVGTGLRNRSLKDMAYMCMLFGILFLKRKGNTHEEAYAEGKILAQVAVSGLFLMEIACLFTYFAFPASTYVTADGVTGYIGTMDGRLCGLVHMNAIGGMSALSIILCGGLIILGIKGFWFYVSAFNIAIATATLVLSGSRTAMIALAVAIVFGVLRHSVWKKLNPAQKKKAVLGALGVIVLGAVAAGIFLGVMGSDWCFAKADALLSGRVSIWKEGLAFFGESPILGVTSRFFAEKAVVDINTAWNAGGIHSIFVGVLVCSGLLGAAILTAFTALSIKESINFRKHKIGLGSHRILCDIFLAFFVCQGFTENYLLYEFGFFAVAFWLVMGIREDN